MMGIEEKMRRRMSRERRRRSVRCGGNRVIRPQCVYSSVIMEEDCQGL
jgi:hypothetical protein